jgi:hypothetical protein
VVGVKLRNIDGVDIVGLILIIMEEVNRMEGRIKTANSRGFGFIESTENIDFYFHHTEFKTRDGKAANWKEMLVRYVRKDIICVEFENDPTAKEAPRALNVYELWHSQLRKW